MNKLYSKAYLQYYTVAFTAGRLYVNVYRSTL